MRRYLVLTIVTFILAAVAPSAFAIRVIFDPPPATSGIMPPAGTDCTLGEPKGLNDFTPCLISKLNTPYDVTFVECSTLTGLNPKVADGWCLFMNNFTGGPLSKFTFQFTVPAGGSLDRSDELQCSSRGISATDNCQDGARVTANEILDLSFFALLPNGEDFFLITDFVNEPAFATVTVSVPEPGELGIFGLGLLALVAGYGWQRRRRQQLVKA